jgi:D-glycero-alpha-D-manno-heptose 1-phosphate guanylyltransferase
MIKTAIILAGGLGTRLRTAVADLPKCMAPVNGIPFISFVIAYLRNEGIENFIFSLGYKSEAITRYADNNFTGLQKKYVIEPAQLGTGGAVRLACKEAAEKNVIVVNGDTLFSADLGQLTKFHEVNNADCTIALKPMKNFDRYGGVELNSDHSIKAFKEKKFCANGTINGGIYALSVTEMSATAYPEVFSFEKGYLEKNTGSKKLYGVVNDGYFIDIGIPEDYQRFQQDYMDTVGKNTIENKVPSAEQFIKAITT